MESHGSQAHRKTAHMRRPIYVLCLNPYPAARVHPPLYIKSDKRLVNYIVLLVELYTVVHILTTC